VSSEAKSDTADLRPIVDGASAGSAGVPHGELLVAYADAVVARDAAAIRGQGDSLRAALGAKALVQAAAVVGNFERMVRIADATGIPLDEPVAVLSQELGLGLGLERFGSARNTRGRGPLGRLRRRLMAPIVRRVFDRLRQSN
jgi:hypothetical protein